MKIYKSIIRNAISYFLMDIYNGVITSKIQIESRAKELGITIENNFLFVKVKVMNYNDVLNEKWSCDEGKLVSAIQEIVEKSEKDVSIYIVGNAGNYLTLVCEGERENVIEAITDFLIRLKKFLELDASVLKMKKVESLLDLKEIGNKTTNTKEITATAVKDYIEKYYNTNFSMDKIADLLNLSSSYLRHLFKEITGENFIDYLIKACMEKAKVLLQNSQCKICEMCKMMGCHDLRHFTKFFKRYTGMAPKAYGMSIEWSRIEPEEGSFDKRALEHYIDELAALKERGIQVFVTLHHFTHPSWFEKWDIFTISKI